MRCAFIQSGATCVAVCCLLVSGEMLFAAGKPSILLIFNDDQRADTIAALGNPVIKTPNLDRLCRQGLSFNRAYMQGGFNGATCVPSRAMLISGRSLFHVDEKLSSDETWPAAFGRAGYTNFATGKWHNGEPALPLSFQHARAIFTGGITDPLKAPLSNLEDGKLTEPKQCPKHACEALANQANLLAHLSGGRLGWAVSAAQDSSVLAARTKYLDDLQGLLKADRVARFAYAEELVKKSGAACDAIDLWRTWWRDVLLAGSGSSAELINIDRADQIQALAQRVDLIQAKAAADACGRALWQMDRNVTARLVVEVLLLDFPLARDA